MFITFQSAIKINQFQFWSFLGKLPRLQPYFLATNRSFSSLFNLQSKSINVKCGQLLAKKTKVIAVRFGQTSLIVIISQSAIKINQFQVWSFVGKIPRLQPYVLATNRSFSSLVNLQSKSINFKCGHSSAKYQGYSLTIWPKIAHFHHYSICNQHQSISMFVICRPNTKVIALLFGQQSLIFITFQSAIKINQVQVWSFVGKIPRLQPYFLATNRSFSSLFNMQSKSINFKCGHLLAKKPRLQPYFLAKNRSFSSLFNLQSKSINFNIGHLSAKYQGYSHTSKPKIANIHHFSICNQNQSISNLVIIQQNTKVVAVRFGHKSLILIFSQSAIKINQFQVWSFVGKIPRLQPYFLATNRSFSSLFNLQSKSINFKCGHLLAKKPRLQPYFLAKNRSFSSLFNLQSKSINFKFGHLSAIYQGYSHTSRPKIANFHHCLICNQNQSISILVIFRQIYQGYSLTFRPQIAHFHHYSICNQNQ